MIDKCRWMNSRRTQSGTRAYISRDLAADDHAEREPYDDTNIDMIASMPIEGEYGYWKARSSLPPSGAPSHIMKPAELGAIVHTRNLRHVLAIARRNIPPPLHDRGLGGNDVRARSTPLMERSNFRSRRLPRWKGARPGYGQSRHDRYWPSSIRRWGLRRTRNHREATIISLVMGAPHPDRRPNRRYAEGVRHLRPAGAPKEAARTNARKRGLKPKPFPFR